MQHFSMSAFVWYSLVSILTRPGGRVQLSSAVLARLFSWFQSSPDPEAGCNDMRFSVKDEIFSFNPHPTRRPGATWFPPDEEKQEYQLFQSSPDPEAGCNIDPTMVKDCPTDGFNPHPTRRPGATIRAEVDTLEGLLPCFNPHPTRRPGATNAALVLSFLVEVSILTRPGGRVQP